MRNLLFTVLLLLVACQSAGDKRLEQALELAGNNRPELEKVLEHYQHDTLKLEAAKFLIRNMPNKFTYEGESLERYDTLFSLLAAYAAGGGKKGDPPFAHQCWDSLRRTVGPLNASSLQKRYDCQSITAGFLINEIDAAFEARQSVPDSFACSFDLFCRYVLPYRIGSEPLEPVRKALFEDFRTLRDSAMTTEDKLIRALFDELRRARQFSNSQLLWDYPVSISKSNMQRARRGACVHMCEYYVDVLRACGVPATIDYVTQWGNRSIGHTWVAIPKDSGQVAFDALEKKQLHFSYKPAKIYRRTYEMQPLDERAVNFVPHDLLSSNSIDVSHLYFPTHKVEVKGEDAVVRTYKDYSYGVICVFDNHRWHPVDYGPVNNGVFTFDNLIGDVCYIAGYYDHNTFIPATSPFILTTKGDIRLIETESTTTDTLHLTRKYPKFPRIVSFVRALKGGVVEVADDANFHTAHKLMDVQTDSLQDMMDLIPQRSIGPHRYVRIRDIGNLAEVVFYGRRPGDTHDKELTGRFFGYSAPNNPSASWQKAIDKDYDSYLAEKPKKENFVALDLGADNLYTVTRIRYVPRSDTNFIIPGQRYRLDYWDGNRWKTVSEKQAGAFSIDFENVPVGRLYLLHCLNGGTEERIFLYEDGKQVWY